MKKILLAFLLVNSVVFAQKPIPNANLEIKLPAEDESYFITGNTRFLNRSGFPVALYQVNYKVLLNSPEQMAKQYLQNNKEVLGLRTEDIQNNLRLHKVLQDATGSVIRFRQTYNGIAVNNNAEITIHINADRMVDFVMNGFRHGITLASTQPAISASTAKQIVENHLQITGSVNYSSNDLMILQNNQTNYLVYRVVISTDASVGEWEAYVNAANGSLLQIVDKACYYHHPTHQKLPNRPLRVQATGTATLFDPDPLTTAVTAYGGSYVDGNDANAAVLTAQLKNVSLLDITLTAGTYSLVGPYAEIRDHEAPNKGLFSQASSAFNFDRSADAFEAIMCYYHIDASMRYLNTTLGLTIMPYQYAGGVRFDPSGLSGADNSHYTGGNGSLAFGEGGVDDAEDADVIIHELGHGIHDWATSGGLSQVNGLSEGSGDYWAASYSRSKGFWPTSNAAYNWTFNWDGHNPFWGGRIVNYTAIYPGGLVNAIHTDGQIWATAMMKIWDDIGRQKADKVFWKGLQLTNSSSSQNDAANAVYTAASTLGYTNAERLAIHTRFTAAGYTLPAFVVPVKVVSFTAVPNKNTINIQWTVDQETIGSIYDLEKSIDGVNFNSIYRKNVLTTNTSNSYLHTDINPVAGANYYRLKETAPSGAVSYSTIVVANMGKQFLVTIYPNPAKDFIKLSSTQITGLVTVTLTNAEGKQVLQKVYNANAGLQEMIPMSHLKNGLYELTIYTNTGVQHQKIAKL